MPSMLVTLLSAQIIDAMSNHSANTTVGPAHSAPISVEDEVDIGLYRTVQRSNPGVAL
eukprot:CAMPEP_0179421196 /NCGR_PEP_ID=MMETSP0799-20121207/9621_1 /TAXON_ID=46947 /ORGANISM="Geminigera cryophila, Strain CCMP2564" /LENGTH=57 /DNA_ID=CAMNT_0021194955 /DNA_START=591 /DNA_END=764 /DNA_ORIENTATION=+